MIGPHGRKFNPVRRKPTRQRFILIDFRHPIRCISDFIQIPLDSTIIALYSNVNDTGIVYITVRIQEVHENVK